VVRTGTERFIIPTIAITESVQPAEKDITLIHGRGELVSLRGSLVPICRLSRVLGTSGGTSDLTDGILVMAESKGRRIALLVDEILGQQQVVIKSLGQRFSQVKGVSGGAILGDGRVSLILDVEGLIQSVSG
jgi:two-component system, chemotaxis family, sensor kinase CheA